MNFLSIFYLFLIIFFYFNIASIQGQTDLERVKMLYYALDTTQLTQIKEDGYAVNESWVSKEHYEDYIEKLSDCKPCIIEWYNKQGNLGFEGVFYITIYEEDKWATKELVGWFKGYYPNGKLEETGQYSYQLNPSKSKNLYRGKKSYRNPIRNVEKVGVWKSFDGEGNVTETEYEVEENKLLEDIDMPQKVLYLVNSFDTTRKIRVSNNNLYDEIGYDTLSNNSSIIKGQMQLTGFVTDISDSTLSFQTSSEYLYIARKSGVVTKNNNCYTCGGILEIKDSIKITTLPLQKINYLSTSSPTRNTLKGLGQFISGASAITTLLIAPLASINYRNGNFNQKRYYRIAGGGLAGFTIGVPLSLFNTEKKYHLSYKNGQKSKKHWLLRMRLK